MLSFYGGQPEQDGIHFGADVLVGIVVEITVFAELGLVLPWEGEWILLSIAHRGATVV